MRGGVDIFGKLDLSSQYSTQSRDAINLNLKVWLEYDTLVVDTFCTTGWCSFEQQSAEVGNRC